jgi:hypothetical protein
MNVLGFYCLQCPSIFHQEFIRPNRISLDCIANRMLGEWFCRFAVALKRECDPISVWFNPIEIQTWMAQLIRRRSKDMETIVMANERAYKGVDHLQKVHTHFLLTFSFCLREPSPVVFVSQ